MCIPKGLLWIVNLAFLPNFPRFKHKANKTAVGQRIIISYSTHWPHFTSKEKDSQMDRVVCAAPFMYSAPDFIHKFKILSQLFFFLLQITFSVYPCLLCVAFWSVICEMLTWNHICV